MATKKKTAVNLEAPWYRFGKILGKLFEKDSEVSITADEEKDGIYNIYISSDNAAKLACMKKLFGEERVMGNITVKLNYKDTSKNIINGEDFKVAFADTEMLVVVEEAMTPIGQEFTYPIMVKDIIQFYDDDITDIYGNANLTVRDAVLEVLDTDRKPANLCVSTSNGTEEN